MLGPQIVKEEHMKEITMAVAGSRRREAALTSAAPMPASAEDSLAGGRQR